MQGIVPEDSMGRRLEANDGLGAPSGALVLEDQILIALEIETVLIEMGFPPVHLASTVDQAMLLLDLGMFRLAVLDYQIGLESSEPVALRLRNAGIPFFLVTGHDLAIGHAHPFAGMPVVSKPFAQNAINEAVTAAATPCRSSDQ
jgi:hypothetical protein